MSDRNTESGEPNRLVLKRSAIARWLVAAAILLSAVVFSEPAPVDLLMAAVIVMAPAAGSVRLDRRLLHAVSALLVATALTYVAAAWAEDSRFAALHTTVTMFLYVGFAVLAGFVAHRPFRHARLLMNCWIVAALFAATAGIAGWLDLFGSGEFFTKYGRASATFKDPNVYGPFLVPPAIHLLDRALRSDLPRMLPAALGAVFLGFGVLVSFSRGAWLVLAVSLVCYVWATMLTSPSNRLRMRFIGLLAGVTLGGVALLLLALGTDRIADQLAARASLVQDYDVGPDGRFGGQLKALDFILKHPFGFGSQAFAPLYHHEEAHNVYLTMLLNAGWIGGVGFSVVLLATLAFGWQAAFRRSRLQPMLIVAVACLTAHVLEGLIVDIDHWRHFYLLMALVWGLVSALPPATGAQSTGSTARQRRSARIAGRMDAGYRWRRVRNPHRSARIVRPPAGPATSNPTEPVSCLHVWRRRPLHRRPTIEPAPLVSATAQPIPTADYDLEKPVGGSAIPASMPVPATPKPGFTACAAAPVAKSSTPPRTGVPPFGDTAAATSSTRLAVTHEPPPEPVTAPHPTHAAARQVNLAVLQDLIASKLTKTAGKLRLRVRARPPLLDGGR